MKILKYPLQIAHEQEIPLPKGAWIVSCQMQGAQARLWVAVPDNALPGSRLLYVVATGERVPPKTRFVATVQIEKLVFHVFDGGEAKE